MSPYGHNFFFGSLILLSKRNDNRLVELTPVELTSVPHSAPLNPMTSYVQTAIRVTTTLCCSLFNNNPHANCKIETDPRQVLRKLGGKRIHRPGEK